MNDNGYLTERIRESENSSFSDTSIESVLIRLLDRVIREKRCLTARERARFSTGVRVLARCRGDSVAQTITSLLNSARAATYPPRGREGRESTRQLS